jgi:hypothetical protein
MEKEENMPLRGWSIPVFANPQSPYVVAQRMKRIERDQARRGRESRQELMFLWHVAEHPGQLSMQIYSVLGPSTVQWSEIRETLLARNEIEIVSQKLPGRGKRKWRCIYITDLGRKTMELEASKAKDPVST